MVVPSNPPIQKIQQVTENTGLSRSSIYRLMLTGKFPRPVKLSDRAVAWRREDIESWLASKGVAA